MANTRILFVDDDTKFKVVNILKTAGWEHTTITKDIACLTDPIVTQTDIFFIDINGVGKKLGFRDEGLGLAYAIKDRYPSKRVIIYSADQKAEWHHDAWKVIDTHIRERQADQAHPVMHDLVTGASECIDRSLPPLIVAPSLFGVTGDWRQVFAQTSDRRPVYGIDIEGNEPYWSESPVFEEIVARCIAAISENMRSTPFHLAGFSFGAWLVYEMACQLERAGNPPRSVVIVDSGWTGTPRTWSERLLLDLPSILANGPRYVAAHADLPSLRRIGRRLRRSTRRLASHVGARNSHLAPILSDAHSVFDMDRLPDLYRRRVVLSMRAQAAYHPGPRPYSGRVAYLECRVRPVIHRNTLDGGWSALVTGPFEVHDIPGSHRTAMDGSDPTLRTIVLDVLQRADTEDAADGR
jgi:thioesterase domain-containing protein